MASNSEALEATAAAHREVVLPYSVATSNVQGPVTSVRQTPEPEKPASRRRSAKAEKEEAEG